MNWSFIYLPECWWLEKQKQCESLDPPVEAHQSPLPESAYLTQKRTTPSRALLIKNRHLFAKFGSLVKKKRRNPDDDLARCQVFRMKVRLAEAFGDKEAINIELMLVGVTRKKPRMPDLTKSLRKSFGSIYRNRHSITIQQQ